jgi:hypothetical protein
MAGAGRLGALGAAHRPGRLADARLFEGAKAPLPADGMAIFWRMVREKLRSLQFFGEANFGRDVFAGLRSLGLLYPLAIAVARASRAGRGGGDLDRDDLDYAVGAVEHAFGRFEPLGGWLGRRFERVVLERSALRGIVTHV